VQEAHDAWPPLLSAAYECGRVLTDMREEALVDAIRRLTDTILPGNRVASGRLSADFSAIARKEPIELAPGILLLHAHMDGVPLPTLAIGSRGEGWPLVALQSRVKIAVILVSPNESIPESHLEALTQIAMAFRNLGLSERLLQIKESPL
jgi:mannitol/fructose-specific phosphotransferase system IIA component (Ntr-type)